MEEPDIRFNYRINQYGVVNPSSEMEIDNNIMEVTNYE